MTLGILVGKPPSNQSLFVVSVQYLPEYDCILPHILPFIPEVVSIVFYLARVFLLTTVSIGRDMTTGLVLDDSVVLGPDLAT